MKKDSIDQIGAIKVPDSIAARGTVGRIIGLGPKVNEGQDPEYHLHTGDRVLYGPYDGLYCIVDLDTSNPIVIMPEGCIRAVLEKNVYDD